MTVARSVPRPARSACRLRFLVRHTHQNALFRKMRFSLPGQTWCCLKEKRILLPAPHVKAHSGLIDSRKGAFCDPQIAQTAPFRYVAAPGKCGATTRQPAGRVVPGSADLGSELGLTERRSLREGPIGKARSMTHRLPKLHLLVRPRTQSAPFRNKSSFAGCGFPGGPGSL